jgi:hypothetical protein
LTVGAGERTVAARGNERRRRPPSHAAGDRCSFDREAGVGSVYNVIELIGTSSESWERAAANAVSEAAKTLRDLRVAEVVEQDVVIDDGAISLFRTKVRLSFKHESPD